MSEMGERTEHLEAELGVTRAERDELKQQMEKLGVTMAAILAAVGVGDDDAMLIPAAVMTEVHGRGQVRLKVGKGPEEGDLLVSAEYDSPIVRPIVRLS